MIEFATLLIGLVVGPRQVELSPLAAVAAIEIRLDDRLVGRLEEDPWVAEIDFGQELVPHRLSVAGYDAEGHLLGTNHQIVNYSRSSFEAAILLDPVTTGEMRTGRIVWRGALEASPLALDLQFDDEVLPVDSDGDFVLPEHDPQAVHVLEASVVFADGSTGLASLTFGGQYVDQTTTALTAVPVTTERGQRIEPRQVSGWIERDGEPVEIFTVGRPKGLVVVLRDFRLERSTRSVLPWRSNMLRRPFSSSAGMHFQAMAISSRPLESASGTFRLSRAVDVEPRYGLRRILLHEGPLVPDKSIDSRKLVRKEQKLWDSLAVAGLNAARKNVPRLVVLMISDELDDFSQLAVDQAVGYLRSIHVPLLVWAPDTEAVAAFGLASHDRLFFGQPGLADLEEEVGHLLYRQTILWIKGDHLPTELEVSAAAPAAVAFAR